MNRSTLTLLGLALVLGPPAVADEVGKDDPKKPALATFNMEDWSGGPDAEENAGKILKKHFAEAFPRGLRVGKEKKGMHSFRFESAEDVRKMLPIRGAPGVMSDDSKEGLLAAGGLAGQLVAAKLNVGFDELGALGRTKEAGATPLAERVLHKKVAKKLRGMTVLELIRVTDKAIAGKYGEDVDPADKVVDLDDDDKADTTLRALREALNLVNNSYQRGDMMTAVLRDPAQGAALDDAVADADDDELGEDEDGDLSPRQEAELERLEAEHDRELQQLEESVKREHEQAVEAGDREKMKQLRERYRAKRSEIDRRFEEKKEQLLSKWRERRAESPRAGDGGRGKGPVKEGVPAGRAKGHDEDHPSNLGKEKRGKAKGKGGGGDDGDDG